MQMARTLHFFPIQLFLVIPSPAFGTGGDDTFSSTSEMAALASREARLVGSLREYRGKLEQRLSKVKMSVEQIKRKLNEEDYDLRVKEVKRQLEEEESKLKSLRTGLAKETFQLPSQRQMEGAAQGIFLLQVNIFPLISSSRLHLIMFTGDLQP